MPERHRIYLIDDHPLVREGLTNLINQQPNLHVCGESEDGARALRDIAEHEPDVAIVDISLKSGSGLELIKTLKARHPRVAVIALSMHDEKLYAERTIRAGARGYVMKRESTKRIVGAIHQVMAGKLAISEQMMSILAQRFVLGPRESAKSPIEQLSDRELEVFNLLGQGLETRKIAEMLNVSIKTVQAYCVRIKQKLELTTATELLREAVRWNEREAGG
ncbi:MAG: response regulator transcription factor [Alphaproteobacteria bacterium]|nr:response regulator transcription factor [Alphaproteobacteria bacterium]